MSKKSKSREDGKADLAGTRKESATGGKKRKGEKPVLLPSDADAGKAPKPPTSGADDKHILLISKAIADPRRLAILRMIAAGNGSCSGVRESLPISAATLSHHMRELEMAGLIETSREGRFMQAKLQRKVWKSYLAELKSLASA